MAKKSTAIMPLDKVQQHILLIRGQRIILAADLARMYGVPVKQLNQAVQRNADRFPDDFVFQLTGPESDALSRSQFVTLNDSKRQMKAKRGTNLKYRPYAFTEHGVLMAANVLRSSRAAKASVFIVRAFVKLRELLATHHQLSHKLDELERKLQNHDDQILTIIEAIRQLMEEPEAPAKLPIGFHTEISPPRRPTGRKKRPLLKSSI